LAVWDWRFLYQEAGACTPIDQVEQ
jgi:hypothetical protein